MKKSNSAVGYSILFLLCATLTATVVIRFISARQLTATYEPDSTQESNTLVQNPFCGFYKINGYMLSDSSTKKELISQVRKNCKDNPYPLVLAEINLQNYANSDLNSSAKQQLDTILTQYALAKKQVILRFLYDWDGKALQSEPSDFYRIKNHIIQISPVINQHTDCVYIIQGVFIGNVGEMNNTNYSDINQIRQPDKSADR